LINPFNISSLAFFSSIMLPVSFWISKAKAALAVTALMACCGVHFCLIQPDDPPEFHI